MEIFLDSVHLSATVSTVKIMVAGVLHGFEYKYHSPTPINFDISFFPQTNAGQCHRGLLTLPTDEIGQHFMRDFGGNRPRRTLAIAEQSILFRPSKKALRDDVVNRIKMLPYTDPQQELQKELRLQELQACKASVKGIQFGWLCRDKVYSIEYEKEGTLDDEIFFDGERREFRVVFHDEEDNRIVVIKSAQVAWAALTTVKEGVVFFLSLHYPPTYESEIPPIPGSNRKIPRRRLVALNDSHAKFATYTSLALRVICTADALDNLARLCSFSRLKRDQDANPRVVDRRGLFSPTIQEEYQQYLSELDWELAFQVDVLASDHLLDLRDILSLRPHLRRLAEKPLPPGYIPHFVRYLAREARNPRWYENVPEPDKALRELFKRCRTTFILASSPSVLDEQHFDCLHAVVTPTIVRLEGPYPELSNRVIRKYAAFTSSFIRVSFVDEARMQLRIDRDVDGREFIRRRFGRILHEGLDIAGQHFDFLAYSQSGLKDHSVWFVKNFEIEDPETHERTLVTADSIIAGLGIFHGLEKDPELMNCPARWGARIAQSLSATEAAVDVEVDEIIRIDDIMSEDGERCFTDGCGTISPEMATNISESLRAKNPRHRRHNRVPARIFQIRFQGSKGVVSVDYKLEGKAVCLRPSMIKFEAPQTRTLEVAIVFNKPSKFYLNRYLIMILEGLEMAGGYEYIKGLQDNVVRSTKSAKESLADAAQLFDDFGLGQSYRCVSTFRELYKMGITQLLDPFHQQVFTSAIHHVLRDVKNRAHIPVPGGWTLVGVADVHEYLNEGEIFACIVPYEGKEPIYLEGPTMISRSPTTHPGDVQIACAIGRPPPDSPFAIEPLTNSVVFSAKGYRPLSSYLAGGDLDGDVYVCTTLPEMLPKKLNEPAEYGKVERKVLDRPSTRQDLADFVTEFLYTDNIGLIAITWLTIADQSDEGIFDPRCLQLAKLNSDATDYPKTGKHVAMEEVPRNDPRVRPDWAQPEVNHGDARTFYPSKRWIGRLYREIELPTHRPFSTPGQSLDFRTLYSLERVKSIFDKNNKWPQCPVEKALRTRISPFVKSPHHYSSKRIELVYHVFKDYISALRTICVSFSLSQKRSAALAEEEVVVGTIVAQTSQPRLRKESISKMGEQTVMLVDRIAQRLTGSDEENKREAIKRSWIAYRVSTIQPDAFGSRSFALIAMRELFVAVTSLEEAAQVKPVAESAAHDVDDNSSE